MSESQAELLISSIRMMAKDLLGARMELDDLDPTEVAESLNHRFDEGDMPLIEAIMEEAGFTGWLTDKIGRRFYFVNGKRQTQAQMKGQGVDKNQMQNLGTAQAPFQDVKSGKAMSSDAKAKVLSPEDQAKWEQWEKANKADWDRVKGSAAEAKAGKTTVDSIDQFTAMMDKAAGELGKAVTVAKLKQFVRELAPQAGEKFGYSGMKKEDLIGRVKDLVEKLGQANTNGELDKYAQPEEQAPQESIETESQQGAEAGDQEVQPEEQSQEPEIQDDQSGESPVDDLVQDEAQDGAQDTPQPKESKPLHKERLASLKGAYKDNPADTEFLDRVIAGEDPEVVAGEVGGVTKGLAKTAQNIIAEEYKNAGIDQPEYGKSNEPTQDANEPQSEEPQVDTEDTEDAQVEEQPPEGVQPKPDQMQSFSSDNMDFDEKVTADQVLGMRDKEFGSVLGTMSHEEKLELADELSSKGDELSKQLEKEGKELRDSEELKKINALYDQVVNASIKDAPEDFNDLEDEEDAQPVDGQEQPEEEPEFDKGEAEPLQGQDAAEDDATNFKYMTDEEFAKEDPASKGFELKDGNWVHKDYPDVSFKDRGSNQAEPEPDVADGSKIDDDAAKWMTGGSESQPKEDGKTDSEAQGVESAISRGSTLEELAQASGMSEKDISDLISQGLKDGTIEEYVNENGDVSYRSIDQEQAEQDEAANPEDDSVEEEPAAEAIPVEPVLKSEEIKKISDELGSRLERVSSFSDSMDAKNLYGFLPAQLKRSISIDDFNSILADNAVYNKPDSFLIGKNGTVNISKGVNPQKIKPFFDMLNDYATKKENNYTGKDKYGKTWENGEVQDVDADVADIDLDGAKNQFKQNTLYASVPVDRKAIESLHKRDKNFSTNFAQNKFAFDKFNTAKSKKKILEAYGLGGVRKENVGYALYGKHAEYKYGASVQDLMDKSPKKAIVDKVAGRISSLAKVAEKTNDLLTSVKGMDVDDPNFTKSVEELRKLKSAHNKLSKQPDNPDFGFLKKFENKKFSSFEPKVKYNDKYQTLSQEEFSSVVSDVKSWFSEHVNSLDDILGKSGFPEIEFGEDSLNKTKDGDGTLAYYDGKKNRIWVKPNADKKEVARNLAHEIGHWIEHRGGFQEELANFLTNRVASTDPEAVKLGTREDRYEATVYDKSGFTEVLSCGVEYMLTKPEWFAAKDPNYFEFVMGVLDGTCRYKKDA